MLPVTWNADYDLPPAFAGMIADSMFTDKVTVPAGAAHAYGTLVATVATTGISVLPIGANPIEGIAIHDHRGGHFETTGYAQYNAMSVMRRGRIWARAAGACTKDAVAKYDAATGEFSDAALATLPQAKFLTSALTIPGVDGGSQMIVLVELHSPFVGA